MTTLAWLLLCLPTPLPQAESALSAPDETGFDVAGLVLPCEDAEAAAAFYGQLGWEAQRVSDEFALVRMDDLVLVLDATRPRNEGAPSSTLHFNLRVASIEQTARAVEGSGAMAVDAAVTPFVLGRKQTWRDPDGNVFTLVELAAEPLGDERLPALFNVSVHAHGMEALQDWFVGRLGFEIYSRDYLPRTLPLVPRGSAALVLHDDAANGDETRSWLTDAGGEHGCGVALLLTAAERTAAQRELPSRPQDSALFGRAQRLDGPAGLELIAISRPALERAIGSVLEPGREDEGELHGGEHDQCFEHPTK